MIVLAVETATSAESVALVSEDKVLAESDSFIEFGHSSTLMSSIEKVFKIARIDISSIDAIAVSAGLRVGFSLAKGLAYAAKKPFYSIPTLDALAYLYSKSGKDIIELTGKKMKSVNLLCPLLDARKEEYYFSLYSETGKGIIKILPENSLSLTALIKTVKSIKSEKIVFIGNGTLKCRAELEKIFKNASFPDILPKASAVGALALLKLQKGEKQDFNKTLPLYIRKPDAVIKKQGKQGKKEK